jgi:hypothetical protein
VLLSHQQPKKGKLGQRRETGQNEAAGIGALRERVETTRAEKTARRRGYQEATRSGTGPFGCSKGAVGRAPQWGSALSCASSPAAPRSVLALRSAAAFACSASASRCRSASACAAAAPVRERAQAADPCPTPSQTPPQCPCAIHNRQSTKGEKNLVTAAAERGRVGGRRVEAEREFIAIQATQGRDIVGHGGGAGPAPEAAPDGPTRG